MVPTLGAFTFEPVAFVRSPYQERFGTPQQASVTVHTRTGEQGNGRIELAPHMDLNCIKDLEGFDVLWVLYVFHMNQTWRPLVRPPRSPKVPRGVFATRSPHRPNSIGLSAVRISRIEGRNIHVSGLDILDGTPVLDLKPYLPYADSFPDVKTGWVPPFRPEEFRGLNPDADPQSEQDPDQ